MKKILLATVLLFSTAAAVPADRVNSIIKDAEELRKEADQLIETNKKISDNNLKYQTEINELRNKINKLEANQAAIQDVIAVIGKLKTHAETLDKAMEKIDAFFGCLEKIVARKTEEPKKEDAEKH